MGYIEPRNEGNRVQPLMGIGAESLRRGMFTKIGRIWGHILQSPTEGNQLLLSGDCDAGTVEG